MKKFEPRKFNLPDGKAGIPKLKGISPKTIEEHLKLYEGYVKHANLILEHIDDLAADSEKFAYELGELQRRFSFEFNGMRNHEYYFSVFEGGPKSLDVTGPFWGAIAEEYGSFDKWLARFKVIGATRGVGWAILYYDPHTRRLINDWVDEQHLGHLSSCFPVLALDMWEHSYVADYQPSGKKQYIEDFFKNLNWSVIEKNYETAAR